MQILLDNISHISAVLPFVLGYIFVVWIASVFWVMKDISNRTLSLVSQFFSLLLCFCVPILGLFIYLLIRPEKTLLEQDFEKIFDLLKEKEIIQ